MRVVSEINFVQAASEINFVRVVSEINFARAVSKINFVLWGTASRLRCTGSTRRLPQLLLTVG